LSAQPADLPIESITVVSTDTLTFEPRALKNLMKLKAARLLSGGTPFSRRALRVDAITVENFYVSHGYLEASVVDSFVITPDKRVQIKLTVTEGKQFVLTDISITGSRLLSREEIIEFLELELQEPYNPVRVRTRLEALRFHYQDRGKLTIDILEELEANEGVHLRLSISEGLTYRIGEITIIGLERVPEWYVLRELVFKEGDTFSRSELLLSKQRVFESGLFSSVEMIPTLRAVDPGIADVEVRVRELERRSLDLSAGFSQVPPAGEGGPPITALNATVEWWHSQILNTSVRMGFTLEGNLNWDHFWPPNGLFAWDFVSPWTLGMRIPTTVRFYSDYRATPKEIRRNGVELSFLSKRLQRSQLRGTVGWVFIKAVKGVADSVAYKGAERSVMLDYRYQGVDNLLAPTRGTIFQIKPSLHGTFIEDVPPLYYKVEADIRRYQPLFWRIVLAYRLKLGYLETLPFGSGRDLKSYHMYDLGGSTSLRGWSKPQLSKDGGIVKGLINAELRIPLFWLLGAEIFVDAGALRVFLGPKDPRYDPDRVRLKWITGWDSGVGITLTTPLGPIRFDTAFKLGEYWTGKPTFQVAFLYTF
jgi:outer membrane protein assembly factor BamA